MARMFSHSRAEMERRWALVRAYLAAEDADALLVQGYEDKIGGNVKWLTDVPPGYPRTVILPREGLMHVIDSGAQGHRRVSDGEDPDMPGVGSVDTTWAFLTAHRTSRLNAEAALAEIRRRGWRRIAISGTAMMPHGFVAALHEGLRGTVRIIDATDFLDACKARKSAEEIVQIRHVAGTQDAVFAKLLGFARPGLRDFEVNAFIDHELQLLGAERGTYIGRSAPMGEPSSFGYRHFQARVIEVGDHITVLLESNGLGGQWTELGRMLCFGRAAAELLDGFDICREAQSQTAALCVPGALAADIARAHDSFMLAHGGVAERRLYAHGMGADMVERPLIREDETMALETGCSLAIHPTHPTTTMLTHICDNFLIDLGGEGRFMHATEKRVFEL